MIRIPKGTTNFENSPYGMFPLILAVLNGDSNNNLIGGTTMPMKDC